jgi:hypothetical protein
MGEIELKVYTNLERVLRAGCFSSIFPKQFFCIVQNPYIICLCDEGITSRKGTSTKDCSYAMCYESGWCSSWRRGEEEDEKMREEKRGWLEKSENA